MAGAGEETSESLPDRGRLSFAFLGALFMMVIFRS